MNIFRAYALLAAPRAWPDSHFSLIIIASLHLPGRVTGNTYIGTLKARRAGVLPFPAWNRAHNADAQAGSLPPRRICHDPALWQSVPSISRATRSQSPTVHSFFVEP